MHVNSFDWVKANPPNGKFLVVVGLSMPVTLMLPGGNLLLMVSVHCVNQKMESFLLNH